MIDGLTAASATGTASAAGGKTWDHELRATIQHGEGIGDEIVCSVRGMTRRCRIIALPKTPIAAAMEAKEPEQRYQQASEIKTEMEAITRAPAESITEETDDPSAEKARVPRRPRLFQVLGLLAVLGGILSIFGTTSEFLESAEIPAWLAENDSLLSAYRVYSIGSRLVQYLLGVAIVPCGFGLICRMPWARRATIWITLFEMALLLAVQAPVDFAMEFQALPADGIVRQPDGNQLLLGRDQMVNNLVFRSMWQTTGLLILNLLVVYYLTRPHVLKLFGEIPEQPVR
jgi:hypothetical protein